MNMEKILKARDSFELFKDGNRSFITVMGWGIGEDYRFIGSENTYCHAGLRAIPYGETPQVVFSRHMGPSRKDESVDSFYKYLIKESPWARCFIKPPFKDVVQDAKKSGFILRTDVPHNLLAGACIASRFATENKRYLPAWDFLRKHYKNKNLAFVLASFLVEKEGEGFYVSAKASHAHFPLSLTFQQIKNFIAGRNVPEKTYVEARRYSRVDQTWGKAGDGISLVRFLESVHLSHKKGGTKDLNIFRPRKHVGERTKYFSKSDLLELENLLEKEL